MRIRTPLFALVAGLALTSCDGPPDEVGKEMTAPEGTIAESDQPAEDDHHGDGDAHEMADHAAEDDHDHDEGERLEAHEHGRATLAAAVDGNEISFTFEAPLASMVGFEHEPETEEQTAALNGLKDAFVIPGNMVSINSEARCLPQTTTSGTHMSGGHGALEVEHVYTCENPGRIERIEFLMSEDYPALETIDAVFLSGTSQSAAELTPSNPVLTVR